MLKKIKNIDKRVAIFSIIGLIALFALACLFPYSGDDWAWGSSIGIDRLNVWFANYNGRYAGNLLILLLSRSRILRALFFSSSVIASSLIIYRSTKNKHYGYLLISTLLLLIIPRSIFSQTYVWASGYTNYFPSIIMTVLCIIMVQNIFDNEKPSYPKYYAPIIAVIVFISSLFMETVTLLNIGAGVLIILYTAIKFRKLCITHISFLAGSLLGAAVMFSNGAYTNIAENEDSYRNTIFGGGLIDFIEFIFGQANFIFNGFVIENLFMFFILCVICITLGIMYIKRSDSKKLCTLVYCNSFINFALFIMLLMKKKNSSWRILTRFINPDYAGHFLFYIITALFVLSLAVQFVICINDKAVRDKTVFYIICLAGVILPLFVVTPIGPRCLFAPYFILIVLIITLVSYIFDEIEINKKSLKYIAIVTTAGLAAVTVFLFTMFIPINHYTNMRDEYIKAQAQLTDRKVIYICKIPYESFIWNGNPKENNEVLERYLLFNGIEVQPDVKFKRLGYERFEKWAKSFNKKTGYKPKNKPRNTKSRFYREEPVTEKTTE